MTLIQAKKHLGQNFLRNPHIINSIVWPDSLTAEHVVEIGPGPGDLTAAILQKNPASLTVIEIDSDMLPVLKKRFEQCPLFIYHADFLKIDIKRWVPFHADLWEPLVMRDLMIQLPSYRIYGNIPYYITSPILFHLFYSVAYPPDVAILTMQKEVADRILARDGKHSVLSLTCHLVAGISRICDINPNNFRPVPKVWSTCLRFDLKKDIDRKKALMTLWVIKKWFAQKRKKLISNLEQWGCKKDILKLSFQDLSIDENIRAEDLTLEQWETLTERIQR